MKVVIVGAGLAGPLLAQGLTGAGIDVELYEREPAGRPGRGYRIHFSPEGDLALRACLPPGLYDRVLATAGRRGSGVRFLDDRLDVVHEVAVPDPPDAERTGRHLTLDRVTLRRIMLTGLDVRHGAAFERYDLLDDGRVRALFDDGTSTDADLLVGADGTHSPIRAQLLPHAEVAETGQSLIFGKTPLTAEVRALAPAAALDGFCAITGPDGRFVSLAAHEFTSGGEDYLMWVVGGPTESFPDLSTLDQSRLREAAADLVADWPPQIAALARLGSPESVHPTTIRTAKPLARWQSGPVTLMGDAIHTMIPVGIGAAVALRDAATLCAHLTRRSGSLLDAVAGYEAEMLDYGFAAVEQSLRTSA